MEWNGIDICLTNLPDFSFISLTPESENNVELHPKRKRTYIYKFKQDILKYHSRQCYCIYLFVYRKLPVVVDTFDYTLVLLISLHYFNVQSDALLVTVFGLPDTVLWSLGLGLEKSLIYISVAISSADEFLFSFSMFVLYMTKLRYCASSEHVTCVRFIPFWTFNSRITGGVRTVPSRRFRRATDCF